MQEKEIKLTIAIPTYNRCSYLTELIPELLKQCDETDNNQNQIEIVISDNASTDETSEYIGSIGNNRIRYYCNKKNIGADANFIESVKRANGKYTWLFGDDELIAKDGISNVLKLIEKQNSALIITNSVLTKSKYFLNYSEVLNYFVLRDPLFPIHHTLITCNIFLRNLFDIDKAYETIKTNYGHMYAIMRNLKKEQGVYIFGKKEKVIIIRERRAAFAEAPIGLEYKLIQYVNYIGSLYNNCMTKNFVWLFYKVINRLPLCGFINVVKKIKKLIID